MSAPDTDADDRGGSFRPRFEVRHVEALLVYGFLAWAAFALLIPCMQRSLGWRMTHDTPFLLYFAYLIDRFGYVPYRDFFDVNMLGSYLSYQGIGHFFGFNDAGVHKADILLHIALMAITVCMLLRAGLRAALATIVLFGLLYFGEGRAMTLQRDYIALLPMSLGVTCAVAPRFLSPQWRALLAGIAFGLAASIKPHMAIGLIPVIFYLAGEEFDSGQHGGSRLGGLFWISLEAGIGALVVVIAYVGYLVYYGALGNFLDSALHYVPLYADMTGNHAVLAPEDRRLYVLNHFLDMGGRWQLIALGFLGLGMGYTNLGVKPGGRRMVALVTMLVAAYMIYPCITGQFWQYHYMPMMFWLCVGASFVVTPQWPGASWQQRYLPLLLSLAILAGMFKATAGFPSLRERGDAPPKGGRVDAIAAFLKKNLEPGDTVQPLDWVGGGILQAMLYADAKPATEFLTYFDFFHHIDLPYIQNLRRRFMESLKQARPRYIIEWTHPGREWVAKGPRTTDTFPEAEAYILAHYVQRDAGLQYIIYERKPDAGVNASINKGGPH